MSEEKSIELRAISVDVSYRRHSLAMGLSNGEVLEEFEIDHRINTMPSGSPAPAKTSIVRCCAS